MRVILPEVAATERLGALLAATCPERGVVYLHGDLGAGKSTLARALLRTLGVTGTIRSPTYTLIEPYRLADGAEAVHLDLYRIAAADELEFLGLDALAAQASLWLIEWPERGGAGLPQADLQIDLQPSGEGRSADFTASSPEGKRWLAQLNQHANLHDIFAEDSR